MTGTKQYLGIINGEHTWRLRVWVTDASHPKGGRQKSRTFKYTGSATGSRSADDALANFILEARVNHGTAENRTVNDLWVAWLDDLVGNRRLSPTTLRDYKNTMTNKLIPELGHIKLRELTPQKLDALYARELERGVTARTVTKYHRILSSMFRRAEKWNWIILSPTRNATAPKVSNHEVVAPLLDMVRLIVSAVPEDKPLLGLLIALAPATGARRGELVGLRWSDIDFKTGTLSIERSAYEVVGGGVAVKSTKSGKPRCVSLDSQALAALERAKESAPEGFIFSDDGKSPWRPDRVTKEFNKIRETVPGADKVRFHDMRHFHATHLASMGFDFVTISKRLGHAKVSTTVDIYTKALAQKDREAANRMGDELGGGSG